MDNKEMLEKIVQECMGATTPEEIETSVKSLLRLFIG